MYSLDVIKKLNQPRAVRLHVRLAKATNNPAGHAKDGEKGRSAKKAQRIIVALKDAARNRAAQNRIAVARFYGFPPPYSREEVLIHK
jgi:hypothetical protein